jgi:hypothetical protein
MRRQFIKTCARLSPQRPLALTSLIALLRLVDHVHATLATNQLVVAVTAADRLQRVTDLHIRSPAALGRPEKANDKRGRDRNRRPHDVNAPAPRCGSRLSTDFLRKRNPFVTAFVPFRPHFVFHRVSCGCQPGPKPRTTWKTGRWPCGSGDQGCGNLRRSSASVAERAPSVAPISRHGMRGWRRWWAIQGLNL